MNSKLTFEYEFSADDDDFGWLSAWVDTPHFKGRNGMWVQWQDVGDFASLLLRFPIEADDPVIGEWGFGVQDKYTEVTKIRIAPNGAAGGLIVNISLANYYEPQNRCRTQFETDYPSLSEFREAIAYMMEKRTGAAILNGSTSVC